MVLAGVACAPGPAPDSEQAEMRQGSGTRSAVRSRPVPPIPVAPSDFSAERAWANLESIVALGPRPADGPAAAAARIYLTNRLVASGLQIEEIELDLEPPAGSDRRRRVASLLARLDGRSKDWLLVAAPYTSPEREGAALPGANEGGSGAAIILELARALAEGDRAYSYLFAFVAGDGVDNDPVAGSRELARELVRRGLLESARAGLFLDRVGDAELLLARDLHSSGPYRAIVWQSARDQGYASVFATDGFDAPEGGHRALSEAGFRQIVALIDSGHDRDTLSGWRARRQVDDLAHCAPESLGIVGTVALDALRTIETRLEQIDRYSSAPADAAVSGEHDLEPASSGAPRVGLAPASAGTGGSQ